MTTARQEPLVPLSVDGLPFIRLRCGKMFIINSATLEILGRPRYLLFFWSDSEKVLLIGRSEKSTPGSYKIGEYYYSHPGRARMKDGKFIKEILSHTGWDRDKAYHCDGEYVPSLSMVAFRLSATEEITTNKQEETDDG